MRRIFQDYDISTQLTAVNALRNSLAHPKDKQQQQSCQCDAMFEICCNPNFACQDAYIGETSLPLQHHLKQHYNGTMEVIQQSSNT